MNDKSEERKSSSTAVEKIWLEKSAEQKETEEKRTHLPEYVVGFSLLTILVSLVLIYYIDLQNAAGLRDMLFDLNPDYFFFDYRPFVFYHWYRNGGVAELFQWLFLGGTALITSFIAARVMDKDRRTFLFWGIMAVFFMLMLIEDAGDPRHTFRSYVQAIFSEPYQGTMGSISELVYFSLLGLIPIYALIRYGQVLQDCLRGLIYFGAGFLFYALATVLSFLGSAVGLYNQAGNVLREILIEWGDPLLYYQWYSFDVEEGWEFVSFFLMDSLVEEALELMGAAAFLAAAISYYYHLEHKRKASDPG